MKTGSAKKRLGPAKVGERRQWADGKLHVRTPDGWKVAVEKAKAKAVKTVREAARNARHEERYNILASEARSELSDLARKAGRVDMRAPSREQRARLRELLDQQRDIRYDLRAGTDAANRFRAKKEAAMKKIRIKPKEGAPKAGVFKKKPSTRR